MTAENAAVTVLGNGDRPNDKLELQLDCNATDARQQTTENPKKPTTWPKFRLAQRQHKGPWRVAPSVADHELAGAGYLLGGPSRDASALTELEQGELLELLATSKKLLSHEEKRREAALLQQCPFGGNFGMLDLDVMAGTPREDIITIAKRLDGACTRRGLHPAWRASGGDTGGMHGDLFAGEFWDPFLLLSAAQVVKEIAAEANVPLLSAFQEKAKRPPIVLDDTIIGRDPGSRGAQRRLIGAVRENGRAKTAIDLGHGLLEQPLPCAPTVLREYADRARAAATRAVAPITAPLEIGKQALAAVVEVLRQHPFPEGQRHNGRLAISAWLLGNRIPHEGVKATLAGTVTSSEDERDAERAAASTSDRITNGKPVRGLNYLAKILGEDVADALECALDEDFEARGVRRDDRKRRRKIRRTDLGNARRLIRNHGHEILYGSGLGWLTFNRGRWVRDEVGKVERLAQEVPKAIFAEAAALRAKARAAATKKEKKILHARAASLTAYAVTSESESKLRKLVVLARSSVARSTADFDRDFWLLNCSNGTLDLRTGKLRPHDRDDLLTKSTRVAYEPNARSEAWDAFLRLVTGGNDELIGFLQRMAGYCLSGDTSEQAFFLLVGDGCNGKSTFVNLLAAAMGDYATGAQFETFLNKTKNSIRSDIARLRGARMVSAIESKDSGGFDEGLIKQLTGGDPVVACFKYQNEFEYIPQFKLIFAANEKPQIQGTDDGIWRRVRLVPFSAKIPPEIRDKHFQARLTASALPAILAWAVRGCLAWQQGGSLAEPKAVSESTAEYRRTQDELGSFIEETCAVTADCAGGAGVLNRELYDRFKEWNVAAGLRPISEKKFSLRLQARGIVGKHTRRGRMWSGLALLPRAGSSPLFPATEGGGRDA